VTGRASDPGAPPSAASSLRPRLLFPTPRARFVLDGNLHEEQQQIVLAARAPPGAQLLFEVDGQSVCRVALPFQCPWRLRRGAHRARVRSAGGAGAASETVSFSVE
jgi:hypothetical protein